MDAMVLGWILAGFLPCFADTPKLPTMIGPIPVTAESQIYGAAYVPGSPQSVDLDSFGYVEEEYFLTGKANLYQYDSDYRLTVKQADIPYTTRIVVRRPRDPRKFSGNVQMECNHPLLGGTLSWSAAKDYILRHGDAYVSVGVGEDLLSKTFERRGAPPVAFVELLKWFEPQRYAPIHWPADNGIRWDVLAQAGALLKSGDKSSPLAGYKVERIYLSGWSFTGSLLRTYINEGFHEKYRTPDGRPIFDAYLIGISASSFEGGYLPINDAATIPPPDNPRRITKALDVPVVELMSQNEALTNTGPQLPDSDDPLSRHRLYEVPGLTHGDGLGSGLSTSQVQIGRRGNRGPGLSPPPGCDLKPSDVPMGDLAIAALANIDLWVRKGIPPPRATRMKIDPVTKQAVTDAFGNAEGGVRTAQLDVPLARYGDYGKETNPACRAPSILGFLRIKRVPLSKAELATLYKNREDYLAKFKARLDQMVKDRWLLRPEAEKELQAARVNADAAFK